VFSYATKAIAASKLMIPMRFGNKTNPKISKASIQPFSSTSLESFFIFLNTSLIIFHFRPLTFFSNNLWRFEALINLTNLFSTLSQFGETRFCIDFEEI